MTGTLASPPPAMDIPTRLRAVAAAARGAHALHDQGQLHGAICPQAIGLVASVTGGPASAFIPATATGGLAGTAVLGPPALANGERPVVQVGYPPLGYVDPQLLRGEGGRWSDIWSLGATVRQVAVGSVPFPGIDELPVVQALSQLLAAPSPAPAQVPAAISELVGACLASDPANRPATAGEVADRLDEAASKW